MSRVIIDDVAVERNLDRCESTVVGAGRNFSLRLSTPAYPYSNSYGCEPTPGCGYDYNYGYTYQYPQYNFNFTNVHRRSHERDFDCHDNYDNRRWSGHHGRH